MHTNKLHELSAPPFQRPGRAAVIRKLISVSLTPTLVLILVACAATSSVAHGEGQQLAVVNGDTITTGDVDRVLLSSHRTMTPGKRASFDYRKLLDKLVHDRLIMQEALAMGMDEEEDFVARLKEEQLKKARRLFVKETFHPTLEISEDDITARFEYFYWKMQVRTIGVSSADEAKRLLAEIKAGAPMDSIAQEISLDSRRFKGGLHNLKYWKDVVMEIREAAGHLAVGEFSEPFRFRDAHMILRVEQRKDANPDERDYFVREIKSALTSERQGAAWDIYLDSLAEHFPAVMDSVLFGRITADSSKVFLGDFLRGSEQPVVRIGDDQVISEQALRREISHTAMNAGDQTFQEILATATEGAIHQSRLIAAAIDQGFEIRPSILEHLETVRDSLLVEIYLNENIVGRITFDRDKFQAHYDEHLEEYREPDEVRIAVIQLTDEATATEAAALLSDGADFDYVASRMGGQDEVDHDENQWFSLETFPTPVAETLERLTVGQNSEPFALAEGWIVFKLIGHREGAIRSIDDVDAQIREVMFQRGFAELLDDLLASLKDASQIIYDEEAITAYLGENN